MIKLTRTFQIETQALAASSEIHAISFKELIKRIKRERYIKSAKRRMSSHKRYKRGE